ncbi:MAG: acetylglutamate kinase [Alphaproteobacteria bacterium]|nr:MAG: acetylglutamate kinase [Alphaproteobacteria bacterium]TAF77260.1 MAG: acetylglutamate kinase [Alphaproteobacteria bacterium]
MKKSPPPKPQAFLRAARTITEALPYMKCFAGEIFVIKYGGHAMGDAELSETFAQDIVLLKMVGIKPVVVHGGGPQIGNMLERLKIKSEFIEGLRVTDKAAVDIVEMVLAGTINKEIVTSINQAGGVAVGISGKDGQLIRAQKLTRTTRDPESNIEKVLDLGFVGEPTHINADIVHELTNCGMIPVIAPIGMGDDGATYNINADTVAGAIAAALGARKLMMLTDVAGVLDEQKELISELSADEARALIKSKVITGGMIPKIETCIHAVEHTGASAHILDGRIRHVLLLETFTNHGAGTMLVA